MTAEIRPLRPDDDGLALWNRSVPLDPMTPARFAEQTDADLALVAVEAGHVVGLGVGALWPVAGDVRGSARLLAVDPGRRRRGIGTALLDALGDGLRQRGATALRLGECAPVYLTPGVDLRLESGLAFAEATGFHAIGESVDLGVDLAQDWATDADEARLQAEGVAVRRVSGDADRTALGRLLDAEWPAWRPEVALALAHDPPAVHVALRDGDSLGFAAHSASHVGLAWFGPMGTAPAARGLGIGAVLLRRCLADLRAAGRDRATIAWAASLPFYERAVGATVDRRYRRFERGL
ncbi:GNAT family N-acetyltransferase [Rubrivirga sp.]|uniref:GNAT family N-acetyltransferase n=1 Tax=Rubrivirga sp. TaxID=1885344 RepID=UPI003B517F73